MITKHNTDDFFFLKLFITDIVHNPAHICKNGHELLMNITICV